MVRTLILFVDMKLIIYFNTEICGICSLYTHRNDDIIDFDKLKVYCANVLSLEGKLGAIQRAVGDPDCYSISTPPANS